MRTEWVAIILGISVNFAAIMYWGGKMTTKSDDHETRMDRIQGDVREIRALLVALCLEDKPKGHHD